MGSIIRQSNQTDGRDDTDAYVLDDHRAELSRHAVRAPKHLLPDGHRPPVHGPGQHSPDTRDVEGVVDVELARGVAARGPPGAGPGQVAGEAAEEVEALPCLVLVLG